jgi:hypothetical protein
MEPHENPQRMRQATIGRRTSIDAPPAAATASARATETFGGFGRPASGNLGQQTALSPG